MVEPSELTPEQHYDDNAPLLGRLASEIEFALKQALDATDIKYLSAGARVKERDSYLEKIVRKSYERPIEQVEDLVGGRVVCYFVTDLPRLREIVERLFRVLAVEDKITEADDDTFGYSSVHFICKLLPGTSGPRYDGLKDFKFEIQTRTILMDAWANVSHYLAYKGEASIPANLRRDFHALAGLFHVADRQFEMLSVGSRQSEEAAVAEFSKPARKKKQSAAFDLPIDRSTMTAYLKSKYPDRLQGNKEAISELVEEVQELGLTSIAALDAQLTRAEKGALAYEKDRPPDSEKGEPDDGRFAAVGIARVALALIYEDFRQYFFDSGVSQYRDW